MLVSAMEGYRRWSATYDSTPNPVIALEERLLSGRLDFLPGQTFLDAGCGTGRWMKWAAGRGLRAFGTDFCPEMISHAAGEVQRQCALADLTQLPFAGNSFETAICSFTLGYLPSLDRAIAELSRVSRDLVVSDLHPEAIRRGWNRSFRTGGDSWEIEHHPYTLSNLDEAASRVGFVQRWRIEAPLGEPERHIFQLAGREAAFTAATEFPAVVITAWRKFSA
jgi:SAM-dependent methyltransferase